MPIKRPLTILIVNHNYERYLNRCLKSVLKNNSKLIKKIIIIDDASKDKSITLIKSLKKKIKNISFYSVKFNSLSQTLNYAIKKVKTKWILKIDADDYIGKNMIRELYKYTDKYDFIFSDMILFDKKTRKKKTQIVRNNFLKYFCHPAGSGNLYKKKLWLKIGGYNKDYKFKDDLFFWIKILKIKNIKIKHINKYLYFYRQHNKSMSKNILKKYFVLLKIIFKDSFK